MFRKILVILLTILMVNSILLAARSSNKKRSRSNRRGVRSVEKQQPADLKCNFEYKIITTNPISVKDNCLQQKIRCRIQATDILK